MHFFREHISNVAALRESKTRQITSMNLFVFLGFFVVLFFFFFHKPIPEELLKAVYSSLLQINSIISENCDKGFIAIFPSQQKPVPSDPISTKSLHPSLSLHQRIFFYQC